MLYTRAHVVFYTVALSLKVPEQALAGWDTPMCSFEIDKPTEYSCV